MGKKEPLIETAECWCGKTVTCSSEDFGKPDVVVPGWVSWKPIKKECSCGESLIFGMDFDKFLNLFEVEY
jgi:hypothetical protein